MAQFISGKTSCTMCGQVIEDSADLIGFPAFLPERHIRWRFSDAAFHAQCFSEWKYSQIFLGLYEQFRQIWASAPQGGSDDERMQWLTTELAKFNDRCIEVPPHG